MGYQNGHTGRDIVHEISNPIEAVINLLYLIKIDAAVPHKVRWYVDQADEPIRCLREIIDRERGDLFDRPRTQ